METYEKKVDIINFIGDSFKGHHSNQTINSQQKKYRHEDLVSFLGVDIVHIPSSKEHMLVKREYKTKFYQLYEENKTKRNSIGILKELNYERKARIIVNAKYDPIQDNDPRKKKASREIDKFEDEEEEK